ncbi:hypothetical protein [Roseovarius autotrophicus]|uniref:hypothetical protein n=1 Tax=Roseovarius autotrophicus TaxID=2824121 RepID=UPI001A00C43E|nr:hypothetical protein [Roseovarius autotrophicus]MBE0452388.1 hypothetical protein [Roseovarius sp.]
MNASQMINMVIRMVVQRLLRQGINKGMDAMSGETARSGPDGRKTAQRTRQAMKLGRRIGRF